MLGTVAFSFAGCAPRDEVLRVYNWGEYMGQDTWKGFEDWYNQKTGNKIKVKYDTFDTNETMYTQIATKKSDYDLICPSDYMLERMKTAGLIKPLAAETVKVINDAVNPALKELVSFDPNLEYAMPYMWGTIGIMYNSLAAPANVNSWSALFTNPGQRKIWMKDSVRDSYSAAMLYHEGTELKSLADDYGYASTQYQGKLKEIFAPDLTNSEKVTADITAAKTVLTAQKSYVLGYDVDNAKNQMLEDKDGKNGEYGLFWSCDAGYIMGGTTEAPRCGGAGGKSDINYNLRYIIPEEGSNVWLDCFAIPEYAGNVDAANLFIQYLCEADVAYDCMSEAGGTSAIKKAADDYKADLGEMDFFKDAPQAFKDNYSAMMFPDDTTLTRCAVMRDFGAFNIKLDEMWQSIYTAK